MTTLRHALGLRVLVLEIQYSQLEVLLRRSTSRAEKRFLREKQDSLAHIIKQARAKAGLTPPRTT